MHRNGAKNAKIIYSSRILRALRAFAMPLRMGCG
jgi:hypothetical protein